MRLIPAVLIGRSRTFLAASLAYMIWPSLVVTSHASGSSLSRRFSPFVASIIFLDRFRALYELRNNRLAETWNSPLTIRGGFMGFRVQT